MEEIVKIVIKGCSGYGFIGGAFKDKITIDSSSISYEYKPVIESEMNPQRKWTYRTTSPVFRHLYDEILEVMPFIIYQKIEMFYTDIGGIEFIVTYADKSKWKKTFWMPGDEFKELFCIIKKMVPGCESVPEVLRTNED